MGIMHFAGLGRSPGAVTAGLAYLKHQRRGLVEYGSVVEGLVLFTSPEVAAGNELPYEAEHNEYMNLTVKHRWASGNIGAVGIITRFFEQEIGAGEVYVCRVDVNDFSACFEAVAKATLRFHPPGEVGKHLWANITGGTNPLNAALFQTAFLSGFISRLYYTFIADPRKYGKYLQPFSCDESLFDYREIYVLKTSFDDRYRHLLEELETVAARNSEQWLTSQDLLGRLKTKGIPGFHNMDVERFKLDFLHVMQGRGVERKDKEDQVRLDPEAGRRILKLLRSNLIQALLGHRSAPEKIRYLTSDLDIQKIYSQ